MNFKLFRFVLYGWFTVLPATLLADDHIDWVTRMQPITPREYVCQRATTPIKVDGILDDAAWAAAPWTSDFVDIQGDTRPKPRFGTRVKMLWDDNYLYIAAEIQEPYVWATLTNHDSVIFQDPDFEVFMDPAGHTQPYYEFEMNALNTTWDLRLNKPYQNQGIPDNGWEIPGAKTAVQVHGTINDPSDTDQGWTVEIAFPWKVLSVDARHAGPPAEGEQWRINFSRVEWQITHTNGGYQKVPGVPEDNWVWSPQGVIDMHRPEMWGLLQFAGAGKSDIAVTPIPGKPARDLALEVYYAQRDFWNAHQSWATNLGELNINLGKLPSGVTSPVIEPTADGYVCAVNFSSDGQLHAWRIRQDRLLKLDEELPVETEDFINEAANEFGNVGRRAAFFLVDNMPAEDRATLSREFLMADVRMALAARTNFPWAAGVPERVYFNGVLPYISVNEPRDPWWTELYPLASNIVRNCHSATEAVQALNRDLFNQINVHYNLGRKRNDQNPRESIEQHKATCTGLSIILVDACRTVGVPARLAGVPEWVNKDGNHTWVEVWVDGDWHYTGADEYDKNGLDRGWFTADAALTARSRNPLNQVYATSWRRTGEYFPMAWDLDSRVVAGVNVSTRYAVATTETNIAATIVHVRLWDKEGGARLASRVELRDSSGVLLAANETRAGTADLNDMPDFTLPETGTNVTFRFVRDGEAKEKSVPCALCLNTHTLEFLWSELTPVPPGVVAAESWFAKAPAERGTPPEFDFTRTEAPQIVSLAWNDLRQARDESAGAELAAKKIAIGDKSMKWMEKTFGEELDGEHSLWITLHGGGEGTEAENDANWHGYFGRYEFPPGSINVAPRAPANTWDMWHVAWVDGLMDRLIADMVLKRQVNPNRVYLIGYSAGGDGVYQLAPRMADRFAAAGMCAGHPNETTPEGLRNLPFFLYMGGADAAYHRNTVVREFSAKMDDLQAADPAGYWHRLTVFPGLPHDMQGREAEMIPRMVPLRRVTWPRRVVWKQDDVTHTRFYWLERAPEAVKEREIYAAHVEGQTITLEAPTTGSVTLRLSDNLVDLDEPIRVVYGGRTLFEGMVKRSFAAVTQSLSEREDPDTVATAQLPISW